MASRFVFLGEDETRIEQPRPLGFSKTTHFGTPLAERSKGRENSLASEAVRSLFLNDDAGHGVVNRGGRLKDLLQGYVVMGFAGAVFNKLVVDEVIERRRGLSTLILVAELREGSFDHSLLRGVLPVLDFPLD